MPSSALKALKKGVKRENNPFELKHSKSKHSIFNKKVRGDKGKPALARKRGIEKRQQTIGQELKGKNSKFSDKRFGELSNMSMQDKLMIRNRRIAEKNLVSESLNFETLTHSGKSLDTIDAFKDGGLEKVDDSDSGELPKEVVQNIHFGGFEGKSKNEVYQEIIQKSKMHKLQRKMAKEADEELTREVDDQLLDIRGLLTTNSSSANLPPVRRFADGSFRNEEDYDRYVKELIYDKRAQATDRLKTEEELALEEKSKLEKLELERLERMKGQSLKGGDKRVSQADDLDDGLYIQNENSFEQPLVYQDGKLVNNEIFFKSTKKQKAEIEEGLEDDESEGDDESLAESDEGLTESETAEEDLSCDEEDPEAIEHLGMVEIDVDDKNSLPYTFDAPNSLDEFRDLIKNRSQNDIDTIIHRIRVLYHKRLHVDNKQKLEV
jgi:nucleolar protein 14